MTLIQLYKHTAKNAPFIANVRLAHYRTQLKTLKEQFDSADLKDKPLIKSEADTIKEYIRILRG